MYPFSIVFHVSVVKGTLCTDYRTISTGELLHAMQSGWCVYGKYKTQAEVDTAFDHIVDHI